MKRWANRPMTNIRKWEAYSRTFLEKIIKMRLGELKEGLLSGNMGPGDVDDLFQEVEYSLHKDLDIFKIQRVLYRHEIIFKGNNKIDIPD